MAERCLAGVDLNPIAVQLARLSLWLTTLARGKPLGFLDHRLRVGNSLIGAAPVDLTRTTRRRSARESGGLPLFDPSELESAMRQALGPLAELTRRPDNTVADVHVKDRLWQRLNTEWSPLHPWRVAASIWCARWFWPAGVEGPPSPAELRALLDAVLRNDRVLPSTRVSRRIADAMTAANEHRFFHWPLEFSDIFCDEHGATKPGGGFDAVIGNPPWEMVRRDDASPDSTRDAPPNRSLLRFVRDSGIYNDSGAGHLNLYQPFLERALWLCRPGGQIGLVLPWGTAVDDGAASLRRRLFERCRVRTLVGIENTTGLFPSIAD